MQQRVRIGAHCFIGGLTGVERDVVPYAMAVGQHAAIAGINVRGLKRRGFDHADIMALRAAFRMFFGTTGRGRSASPRWSRRSATSRPSAPLIEFLRAAGDRPLTLPRKAGWAHDDDLDA